MVDLRVNMIGPSGQNDAPFAGLLQILQHLLALFLHILSGAGKLLPGRFAGIGDFSRRDFGKFLGQRLRNGVQVPEGHKGIAEGDLSACDFLHIVFDIFRIGGDNRTVVMVIGVLKFVALIKESRIENKGNALTD